MAKDWFSLTQVAQVCRVHRSTVCRWIDDGLLEPYKLPGSTHRRVMLTKLREFMAKENIPTDLLDAQTKED